MSLCQPDGQTNERTGTIKTNKRAKESERAAAVASVHVCFMLMIKLRQETDAEKATTTRMTARCILAPLFH